MNKIPTDEAPQSRRGGLIPDPARQAQKDVKALLQKVEELESIVALLEEKASVLEDKVSVLEETLTLLKQQVGVLIERFQRHIQYPQ